MASASGLEIEGLVCERGGKALFGPLNLHVPAGVALLVSGPNGSGKSTLLRAIAGLSVFEAGSASWNGVRQSPSSRLWRTRVAYAGHRSGLKDELTARENLELACALDGTGTAEQSKQALEQVGLTRRGELPVKRLSQGQKQRLTLARLLLSRRPLWLLDEPTAALDAGGRELLRDLVLSHLGRRGVAVVATHDRIGLPPEAVVELRLT